MDMRTGKATGVWKASSAGISSLYTFGEVSVVAADRGRSILVEILSVIHYLLLIVLADVIILYLALIHLPLLFLYVF